MITINKPVIFFDLETTGLEITKDQILELAAFKIMPSGEKLKYYGLFKPSVEISEEAAEIHGITQDMVADKPAFKEKAAEIYEFFKDCDLGGYNVIRFDIPMLVEELHRAGIHYNPIRFNVLDVFKILQEKEPRNLGVMYKYYTGKDLENAHSAEADIEATIEIFEAQITKYGLPQDIKQIQNEIIKIRKDGSEQVDFNGTFGYKGGNFFYNIGKHKGKNIDQSNVEYLDWIINKSDYAYNVKHVAQMIKNKLFGQK